MSGVDNPTWICSACVYVRPRPGLTEEELLETEVLTIVNGHLICMRHLGSSQGGNHHHVVMTAVFIESGDEHMGLTEYQDWRHAQDRNEEKP